MTIGGRVPMLDLEVWVEKDIEGNQQLLYSYYEKPITSSLVIMAKSALIMRMKMTVLSQEI